MTAAAQPPSADDLAWARACPKVLLHEHLDGGLRVATLLELLHARGIAPPVADVHELERWFDARAHAGSLEAYLEGFALTVAAMAEPAALTRVAFEAAEDARAGGCVAAEFRIAPLLFERHGVAADRVVEALLEGLARSALPSGLIVCAMREQSPAHVARSAELARRWHGHGVIAFDLAGAEGGHPVAEHAAALERLHDAGVPMTLHAGEADAAERVLEAGRAGARRIGHGVRLADALADPARAHLLDEAKALGLHLEICPTSNVHTGAARSLAEHPITALWRAGASLSVHTDNTLMSRISLAGELAALLAQTPLTRADLVQMQREAAGASFLAPAVRAAARDAIDAFAR